MPPIAVGGSDDGSHQDAAEKHQVYSPCVSCLVLAESALKLLPKRGGVDLECLDLVAQRRVGEIEVLRGKCLVTFELPEGFADEISFQVG